MAAARSASSRASSGVPGIQSPGFEASELPSPLNSNASAPMSAAMRAHRRASAMAAGTPRLWPRRTK
jgi:hypothetical protein